MLSALETSTNYLWKLIYILMLVVNIIKTTLLHKMNAFKI